MIRSRKAEKGVRNLLRRETATTAAHPKKVPDTFSVPLRSAIEHHKPIIPVFLSGTDRADVPPFLQSLKSIEIDPSHEEEAVELIAKTAEAAAT
jgi:hypothetical protein